MEWGLFVAKKVISVLFYPVGTTLVLLTAGIIMWCWRPRSKLGVCFVTAGALWLLISSMGIVGTLFVLPLERSAGSYANPQELSAQQVKYIVVLGGGIRTNPVGPLGVADCDSFFRVLEGIRLWKAIPGSKLIVSGGRFHPDDMTSGEAMATVARQMGVPPVDIIEETRSLDTLDEARFLKPLLGQTRFALVTSALHMSRSLETFRGLGMNPIAAPTDFRATGIRLKSSSILPSAKSMVLLQRAIHEYVGMLWMRLKALFRGK